MTKEEVLALCTNDAEKERVEAAYTAAVRFNKVPYFAAITSADKVKEEIKVLVDNYTKRMEAKAKRDESKKQAKEIIERLKGILAKAVELGMTEAEFCDKAESIIKVKYNEKIQAEIDKLKSQMM